MAEPQEIITNQVKDKEKNENKIIEKFVMAAIEEQRRARRWGIFFKLLTFGYLILLLILAFSEMPELDTAAGEKHTALVKLNGVITDDSEASASKMIKGLRKAFKDKDTAGVILRINSPGGSPVQSAYINAEIKRLRKEYPEIPLYAVITDLCASGGYYVAVAADKIYADPASIVGSIGVLMNGFGFTDTMRKLGVERRLLTAGEHKGMLDPFSPAKPEDTAHLQTMLDEIHQQFIQTVKQGRGERLKGDPKLFSGLVWTGERAVELGLVDALATEDYVAREIIGAKRIVNFTPKRDYLERLAEGLGTAIGSAMTSEMQWRMPGVR